MKNKSKMTVDEFGNKFYKLPNGDLHRENGPAIEWTNGDKFYYLNGKLYREDDPAIESPNGDKEWFLNGKRHREDGPAVESDGDKYWFLNGKRHRKDGPALENSNGRKEWFLNDRLYKIQTKYKTIERDKNFDCETCVSQIVCDYDCQEDIIWREYHKK